MGKDPQEERRTFQRARKLDWGRDGLVEDSKQEYDREKNSFLKGRLHLSSIDFGVVNLLLKQILLSMLLIPSEVLLILVGRKASLLVLQAKNLGVILDPFPFLRLHIQLSSIILGCNVESVSRPMMDFQHLCYHDPGLGHCLLLAIL